MRLVKEFFVTFGFIGHIPWAPGTCASWGTVCILYLLYTVIPQYFSMIILLTALLLFILGVFWTNYFVQEWDNTDPPSVVIDECVGMILSFLFISPGLYTFLWGFILFRFLDIFKPWPIYLLEQFPDGWGIMLDDVVAGIITALVLYCVQVTGQYL